MFFTALVNKQIILDLIIATLSAELAALTRAANTAFAAATDPDSKAENKYDTRSLEASYVARGQAQRVADLQEAVDAFGSMPGNAFADGTAIGLGTLVSSKSPRGISYYFIAAHAGGTEVQHDGQEVFVITPASPLGQKLMGLCVGDSFSLHGGLKATVASVQ